MTCARLLLCVLMVVSVPAARAAEASEAAALQAAEAWLKLIDTGQYGASWDGASSTFRKAVSRSTWEKKAAAVREPLGKVLERRVSSQELTHELPGAPDGTYVVLIFDTRFEHKERGHETVIMTLEDIRFRAASYFIR